jgi:hypothetical protein
MSIISSLTNQQIDYLTRIAASIERKQIGPAIGLLFMPDNCLGKELSDKILKTISIYKHVKIKNATLGSEHEKHYKDLTNRIRECNTPQEAFKVLIPDEPHQAVIAVLTNPDLVNEIASSITPLNGKTLAPTPVNQDCPVFFPVNQQMAVKMQLKRRKHLSFREFHSYKDLLRAREFAEMIKKEKLSPNVIPFWKKHFDDKSCAEVVQYCPALTHVDMSSGDYRDGDEFIVTIAKHCPNLEYIDLTGCRFSPESISALVTKCHKLTSISLRYLGEFSPTDFSPTFALIAKNTPMLKHIGLSHASTANDAAAMHILFKSCIQLESINLSYCTSISDALLATIAKNCSHLSSIELTGCPQITNVGLDALKENNPHLAIIPHA